MNWLIKLLGGYSKDDMDFHMENYNKLLKQYRCGEDKYTDLDVLNNKLKSELKQLKSDFNNVNKKYKKYYNINYRARKYLDRIKPSSVWSEHYKKIMGMLDNN